MTCMFSVSYTDISTNNLELHDSNIHNIELVRTSADDKLYSGLIHVRYTNGNENNDITITNFCFVDNTYNANDGSDNPKIVSKGTWGGVIRPYKVILKNCYYDWDQGMEANDNAHTEGCQHNTWTLNNIPQLDLGECKGVKTAEPLTPSPTAYFTETDGFTKTGAPCLEKQ